jgi:putative transposase
MPWNRTNWMSKRVKFIAAYLEHEANFTDLCRDFGISRKTGYKWIRRYEANGAGSLEEHSRAPHSHPNAVSPNVVQAILAIRRLHPRWGSSQAAAHLATAAATPRASGTEHHR